MLVLKMNRPSEAEITDLQFSLGIQQEVFRLDIPVDVSFPVHNSKPFESLENEALNLVHGKSLGRLLDLVQNRPGKELENNVELLVLSERLLELDYVFVLQSFQRPHFPERDFPYDGILLCLLELLNRHHLLGLFVDCLEHDPVGPHSDHTHDIESFHRFLYKFLPFVIRNIMGRCFKSIKEIRFVKDPKDPTRPLVIGSGGFSKVKLICHVLHPDKLFALKKLFKKDAQEVRYIKQEISIHQNLTHPNIIQLIDCLETEKYFYLILEYASQGDLFDLIHRRPISFEQKLHYFYQVVQGICYMHQRGIMHRDIKPENILVDAQGTLKLCDFGWSAKFQESQPRKTLCGTHEYMALEIFTGKKQSPKADIWSLGILLYEILFGQAPFRGRNIEEIMEQVVRGRLDFPKETPEEVRALLSRILSREPERRPSTEEILANSIFEKFERDQRKTLKNTLRLNASKTGMSFAHEIVNTETNEKYVLSVQTIDFPRQPIKKQLHKLQEF